MLANMRESRMKITHYLYNTFLIEHEEIKLAIDPGQHLWLFDLRSLIPKIEWPSITHVLVTHGDPDHYWQADRVAITANAPLILNATMVKEMAGEKQILAPRKDGLRFVPFDGEIQTITEGDSLSLPGMELEAIPTQHGPIRYRILGIKQEKTPGPNERTGFGSIGFRITLGEYTLINLGDSLLLRDTWQNLTADILMLPIGGLGNNIWTMDINDALEAVRLISPKIVIPCHYNVPFFLSKKFAPADDIGFKHSVEKMGISCHIMQAGESFEL